MPSSDIERLTTPLLQSDEKLIRADHLSELWAGYGHIYRLHLKQASGSQRTTRILKTIDPPSQANKGKRKDEGHLRKMFSYQIEANFYRAYAARFLTSPGAKKHGCGVPKLFAASERDDKTQVLLLQDLTQDYPVLTERRATLSEQQVDKAIEWLATFHATFWNVESPKTGLAAQGTGCPPPLLAQDWNGEGLWQQGGYSYLATRMDELRSVDSRDGEWGSAGLHEASELPFAVDWCLNNPHDRRRLSLIHGDVKAANMAFSEDSTRMAMYDFQYVGKGLGVQDLAKFLTTSIGSRYLKQENGEVKLLRRYHSILCEQLPQAVATAYPFQDLMQDWELALVSWVRFLAGWSGGFWGNVDWLTTRVSNLLHDPDWTAQVIARWRNGDPDAEFRTSLLQDTDR
ncbi:hypothetical protein BCV70DRAFT_103743 [Testicularia cyperi]|uniref:CHK kinase-like domain-containing protein n=1 Tax=Testicularia cyperi TaxID=1882483 RepID=A0A317XRM1_9BASI|nr:hypothetical protein BCV70DRAFT_103743 [Testicularia cyperi]